MQLWIRFVAAPANRTLHSLAPALNRRGFQLPNVQYRLRCGTRSEYRELRVSVCVGDGSTTGHCTFLQTCPQVLLDTRRAASSQQTAEIIWRHTPGPPRFPVTLRFGFALHFLSLLRVLSAGQCNLQTLVSPSDTPANSQLLVLSNKYCTQCAVKLSVKCDAKRINKTAVESKRREERGERREDKLVSVY